MIEKSMARPRQFKTYFFHVASGYEAIRDIILGIDTAKFIYVSDKYKKRYRLDKSEVDANTGFLVGDLQQMHNADDVKLLKTSDGNHLDSQEDFDDDEFLGYNNVFAFALYQDSAVLALQHNNNGCGASSFAAMLTQELLQNPAHFALGRQSIDFIPLEPREKFENAKDFTKLAFSFKTAKFRNLNDESFSAFNNIGEIYNAEEVSIVLKNPSNLTKIAVTNIVESFQKEQKERSKNIAEKLLVDCIFDGGENAELNFLYNKANTIESGIIVKEYNDRRGLIIKHLHDFIQQK